MKHEQRQPLDNEKSVKTQLNDQLAISKSLKAVSFMSEKFNSLIAENRRVLEEMKSVRKENWQLKSKIVFVEERINSVEYKETLCNIEITGTQISDTNEPTKSVLVITNNLLQCNFKLTYNNVLQNNYTSL